MSKNSKELKEELFERTGALHRKLIPASDSIREGYILMGRRDLIPQIRKLVLRATALVFMKYKKDVVVKELPLISVQSVALHNRNRACFALKVRTKRKLKTIVLETRNSVDSSSWVDAIKNALTKLHASSSASAPKASPLNRSRRHSDPPTPTFTKVTEPDGKDKKKADSKDAESDDDDDDEDSSESESEDSEFGDPRAGSKTGNQGSAGIPQGKMPLGAFQASDLQKPPPQQQPLPGWPLPGQVQQNPEIAFNPFAVNVAAGQPGVPFGGFGAPIQTSQFIPPQQIFLSQQMLQQQQQQQFQQVQQQHTQQMQQLQQQQLQQQQQQARQPYVMCSSLTVVPEGTKVVKEHGFVSATVTEQLGQLLHNNPGDLDSKVDQLREQAQRKLVGQVVDKGGNAALGITFNMSFQPSGAFVLCAFGTACSLA